jgi:Fe2+ or Zn2+ uptake regulation protein|tara:strand:+ start:53 stop:415 length:363 start_codon:yes stop_codon:yes gene_type:complete
MRFSKQRELIKNIVQGTNSHPTADWIYKKAKKKLSNISLGTVYRNLSQLNQDGIINILYDNNIARYDWNTVSHDHLKCQQCGDITDVHMRTEELQKKVWKQYKFKADNIEINIIGTCKKH